MQHQFLPAKLAALLLAASAAAQTPRPADPTKSFDPYAVLGVSRVARKEDIRAAYRREMSNYHPDKVAHLGYEFQEIAKEKALAINRAYEMLTRS